MSAPRVPPRFVPTLTTVLEPGDAGLAKPAPAEPPTNAPEAEVSFQAVPTLQVPSAPVPSPPSPMPPPVPSPVPDLREAVALDPATRLSEMESFVLEEQLLHRVLQRVDLSLEDRLSDVVAAAVQAQLDEMVPRLRDEIEGVLRSLVIEALAQELHEKPGSNPPGTGHSFG